MGCLLLVGLLLVGVLARRSATWHGMARHPPSLNLPMTRLPVFHCDRLDAQLLVDIHPKGLVQHLASWQDCCPSHLQLPTQLVGCSAWVTLLCLTSNVAVDVINQDPPTFHNL